MKRPSEKVKKSARLFALEILKDLEEFDDVPAKAETVIGKMIDKEIISAMETPEIQKKIKKYVARNLSCWVSEYVDNIIEDEGLAKDLTRSIMQRIFKGK